MKVLLINPPSSDGVEMVREGRCMQRKGAWTAVWAPISLASIAAVLELNGFECLLVDAIVERIDELGLVKIAREFEPEMAIINTATPSIVSDLNLATRLKKTCSQLKIFAIGIHPTALPEETLEMGKGLDGIIRAEPEMTALELAERIRERKGWQDVAGISYRDGLLFYHNPERVPLELDELPFPSWHLVKRELYRMPFKDVPFLLVGTNRGCPFKCRFCADSTYYGKRVRLKSPLRIMRELDWIKTKFAISEFLFWAESFTINQQWSNEVAEVIKDAKLNVSFVCNSRPDQVSEKLLSNLKQAGCWMIGYGLESGSNKVLEMMGKGITVEDNRKAIRLAKEAGLLVTGHFVLGYPGETLESINETIEFACNEPLDFAQFYCAVPFPGSFLYKEAKKQGWINTINWSRFEQNYSVLDLPGLKAKEVMQARKLAYRKFYHSPRRAFSFISKNFNSKSIFYLLRTYKEFQEWIEK